jgi:cephalosporin hydroxylase
MIKNLTDNKIEKLINEIPIDTETSKPKVFISSKKYLSFLSKIIPKTLFNEKFIKKISNDFKKIDKKYLKKLFELDYRGDGDLRYHSFTLFLLTRIIQPNLIIETGVNNGKSSVNFLFGLRQNKKGRLISIDKKEIKKKLKDGRIPYKLVDNQIGWLIPKSYKTRWKLYEGDSLKVLNMINKKNLYNRPSIFLHDSLHTMKHTYEEIKIVSKLNNPSNNPILILVDDINMGSGKAFKKFLFKNKLTGYSFRTLGSVTIEKNKKLLF